MEDREDVNRIPVPSNGSIMYCQEWYSAICTGIILCHWYGQKLESGTFQVQYYKFCPLLRGSQSKESIGNGSFGIPSSKLVDGGLTYTPVSLFGVYSIRGY